MNESFQSLLNLLTETWTAAVLMKQSWASDDPLEAIILQFMTAWQEL